MASNLIELSSDDEMEQDSEPRVEMIQCETIEIEDKDKEKEDEASIGSGENQSVGNGKVITHACQC